MKNKLNLILTVLLAIAVVVIAYQNLSGNGDSNTIDSEEQLYTCGMHPEIISNEPGNCPICEMKLTPIKNMKTQKSGEKEILYWRAPMDPNEIYDSPGKSKMGMDLVPVYNDESGNGIVSINPAVVQNMNVKTAIVEKRELNNTVVTNGILTTNETEDYIVTTRLNGWVNKLYVNYTGQKVKTGEKLLDIYSPELVAAQQELLTAIAYQKATRNSNNSDAMNGGDELIRNAVRKLELLEMSNADIENLKSTGKVKTYISMYAQNNGTVITKNVIDGQKITPGMQLMQISDLSTLWLTADIYEYELSKISLGSSADIKFNFNPGEIFRGKINFIYPTIDSKTRTAKIRIDIPNNNGMLKPSMIANVVINGNNFGDFPVIPENSVIRGGRKDVVIIDLGKGKFKAQEVKLGGYSEGYYQVLSGLSEGTKIVTSAQFLIDSESNLKAAVSQYSTGTTKEQAKEVNNHTHTEEMKMDENSDMGNMSSIKIEKESIVREGVIDVKVIDNNSDSKVFQCPMDWNVISDSTGRCPLCEMKLKEYMIDDAENNLKVHGYDFK